MIERMRIVAATGEAGPETAEPPDHEINWHACRSRFTQRRDDLGVFELVHLGHDMAGARHVGCLSPA